MNEPRHFSKYQLCSRCHKELPLHAESVAESRVGNVGKEVSIAAPQQNIEAKDIPLDQQIQKTLQPTRVQLCTSCQALAQLQDSWKPFPLGASIGAIFFVPDKSENKGN